MRRLIFLLITVIFIFSLATPAFASDTPIRILLRRSQFQCGCRIRIGWIYPRG